jgi:tetratricopeptide (TPR) repeat protein
MRGRARAAAGFERGDRRADSPPTLARGRAGRGRAAHLECRCVRRLPSGPLLREPRTRATNQRALEEYKRAVHLDPNYALAWSSLAFTYASSTLNADGRPLEVAPHARDAAERSVRANPDLSEAQFALGYVNWLLDWNWPAAEARLRLAIGLDPGNGSEHRVLGHILSQAGRHAEAAPLMRRARELEPLEPLKWDPYRTDPRFQAVLKRCLFASSP